MRRRTAIAAALTAVGITFAGTETTQTMIVVSDLNVPTILTCRTESGPADGDFRWRVCVPDESPDGAPLARGPFEDGSALYADGWSIGPDDESAPFAGVHQGTWQLNTTEER